MAYPPQHRQTVAAIVLLAGTFLTFTTVWLGATLGTRVPSGTNQIIALGVFLFNASLLGRGSQLPRRYQILVSTMAVYLIVCFLFYRGNAIAYTLGAATTFEFVAIFILAHRTAIQPSTLLMVFAGLLCMICGLSAVTITQAILLHVPLRYAPTMFREAGALGGALSVGVLLSLCLYRCTSRWLYLLAAVALSMAVVMGGLKKELICLVLSWFLFAVTERERLKAWLYVALVLACALVGFSVVGEVIVSNIESTVATYERQGADQVARSAMYLAAVDVAADYFPFGSGMGTFGSLPSVLLGYSDVYRQYGLDRVWGLSPANVRANAHFIFDTYWPHVLGELGFIGTPVFALIWFFPAITAYRQCRSGCTLRSGGLRYFVIGMCLVSSIHGLVLFLPENSSFIIFHSGLVGYALAHLTKLDASQIPTRAGGRKFGWRTRSQPKLITCSE